MPKTPIDFTAARNELEADQYRYLQGVALVELFHRSRGREPASFEELDAPAPEQAHGSRPEKIHPFDVLTREQIEAALAQFKREPRRKGGA